MANTAALRQKIRARRGRSKQQTKIWLLVGISILSVVVVGGLIAVSQPDSGEVASADYTGLTQQIDGSGAVGFSIGDPDASVALVEYSDFWLHSLP